MPDPSKEIVNGVAQIGVAPGFSAKEQRVIVRYLHHMKEHTSDIHKLLMSACGEAAASYKLVKQWVDDDSKGHEDQAESNKKAVSTATNGAISPKQIGPTDPALVCRLEYLVNSDRRISLERAAEMSIVGRQTAQHVICDVLGLKKVTERWVPRLWTPEQRQFRVHVATELSKRYEIEGEEFIDRIIVGDESVVFYYTPDKLQRKSSAGLQGAQCVGEKYRPGIEQERVHFMIFYDSEGLILMEEIPDVSDDPGRQYAHILKGNLAQAYARKRKGKDISTCLLLTDNTAPHISSPAHTALAELDLKALPHPPASPDFEPHEYWFIPFVKNHTKLSTYKDRHELTAAINHHLKHLVDRDYAKSLRGLPQRWAACKETLGLYVL